MAEEEKQELEGRLIEIVAVDRIYKPITSIDGKLKRRREKLTADFPMATGKTYNGDRVYARVEESETMKARGMSAAIDEFAKKFPRYGEILRGMIAEKRVVREKNLIFRMQEGRILSSKDYLGVLLDLGFTPSTAESLYPELVEISRKLSKKRAEQERVIMLDQSYDSRTSKD